MWSFLKNYRALLQRPSLCTLLEWTWFCTDIPYAFSGLTSRVIGSRNHGVKLELETKRIILQLRTHGSRPNTPYVDEITCKVILKRRSEHSEVFFSTKMISLRPAEVEVLCFASFNSLKSFLPEWVKTWNKQATALDRFPPEETVI